MSKQVILMSKRELKFSEVDFYHFLEINYRIWRFLESYFVCMFTSLNKEMSKKNYILVLFLFIYMQTLFSQVDNIVNPPREVTSHLFYVNISVLDKEYRPIKNAEVYVNGATYSFPNINNKYIVRAKVGDELRVSHPDFETVYYTIKSSEDIKVLVEGFAEKKRYKFSNLSMSREKPKKKDFYLTYIDSAKFYQKKDIEKSLSFIENSLKIKQSRKRNAVAYKTLADIYLYWKQYDLAINNYKLSLQINSEVSTKIQLAKAQFLNKNYVASEKIYKELINKKLSNYEKIITQEGLGDVYFSMSKYNGARINYEEALQVAKKNLITSKITDLNSKIAEVFAAEGNILGANMSFLNTLDLAAKESPKRALKQEEKVADFYNNSNQYDNEIELRKKSLQKAETKDLQNDSLNGFFNFSDDIESNDPDSITSQKINYKIGNAYILKEDYKEAIPFLEKSIKDSKDKEDIIIEKDATRKLSESYANIGEYDKALKSYQEYVKLVDESYIRKEQEIQQVKRFSKKIADNQNRISSLEKDKELAESKISLAYIDQRLSEESNRRQRQIIYSLVAGFLLMSLLAYFMFRNNKQQKLANNLLALKSMRSQMNPHFIFNALNSVNSFIAVNDERNANRYLSEFSALMRSVLENSDEDFIPLTKEIELLELYVKLEHNRFKDKFDYQINIDKNINLEQFSIPPMLLQPYIENAIWHGLRYKKEKGNLEISIDQKDSEIVSILIIDNGIGRKQSQELKTKNQLKQKSKGMSTIKNRIAILNNMYKDRVSVEVSNVLETGEGTKVELLLKKK